MKRLLMAVLLLCVYGWGQAPPSGKIPNTGADNNFTGNNRFSSITITGATGSKCLQTNAQGKVVESAGACASLPEGVAGDGDSGLTVTKKVSAGSVAVGTTVQAGQVATLACGMGAPCSNAGITAYTDHTAINAKIASVSAAGGGKVTLGYGDYYLGVGITVLSNVDFAGQGVGFTKLHLKANTRTNVVSANGATNFAIHDMSIDGGGAENQSSEGVANDSNGNGVLVDNSTQFRLFNLETYGNFYHGVFVLGHNGGSSVFEVAHLWSHDNGYRAIHIHGTDLSPMADYIASDIWSWHNGRCAVADLNCPSDPNPGNSGVFLTYKNARHAIVANIEAWDEPFSGIEVGSLDFGTDVMAAKNVTLVNSIAHDNGIGVKVGPGVTETLFDNVIANNNTASGWQTTAGTFTVTGTTANGSNTITAVSSTESVFPGATITGTNIPASTRVVDKTASTIVLSANATGDGAVTLTIAAALYNVAISGGQFNGNGANGINFGNVALNAVSVHGAQIQRNAGAGINLSAGSPAYELSLLNNTITDNANWGISMGGNAALPHVGAKIEDNTISRNTSGGVFLSYQNDCAITGNTGYDNNPSAGGATSVVYFSNVNRCNVAHNVVGYITHTPTATLFDASASTASMVSFIDNECVNPAARTCIAFGGNGGSAIHNFTNGTSTIVNAIASSSNILIERNWTLNGSTFQEIVLNTGTNNTVLLKNPDAVNSTASVTMDSVGHNDLISTNASGTTAITLPAKPWTGQVVNVLCTNATANLTLAAGDVAHTVSNAPTSCGPTTPFAMKFDGTTWYRYR